MPAMTRRSAGVSMLVASLLCLLAAAPAIGEMEPAGGPVDLNGKPVNPLVGMDGRAVVLVFVKVDCPISNRYAPLINSLAARYADKEVGFWLVYPDRRLSEAAILKHRRDYAFSLPAIQDPGHDLVRRSGARVTPQAAVFVASDEDINWGRRVYTGRIDDQYIAFGKRRPRPTRHDLEEVLEAVTTGQTPEPTVTEAVGCAISPSTASH